MATWQRQGTEPIILHSDRGCQFTNDDYQRYLEMNTMICSMSAVGHCGDNAACEGFFGMLKRERVNRTIYRTLDMTRSDLFDYIERFHNPRMRRRLARQDQKFLAFFNRPCKRGRTHQTHAAVDSTFSRHTTDSIDIGEYCQLCLIMFLQYYSVRFPCSGLFSFLLLPSL
ncbi:integrase-like protein [Halothiobacillus neapolitanus]|nr:integrase-like protein [Halothiobacillus neapolitanus]